MHEMGITQGVLAASIDAAAEAGATRITAIRLNIGDMTEIVEDALQFAFEALSPGTMAEGAVLEVTFLPARSRCMQCGVEFEHSRFEMLCPECGSFMIELLQGRELEIVSIDADVPDDDETAGPASADSAEEGQETE
jgi:hydrogenase nickel incorporation protein HypA/HybF